MRREGTNVLKRLVGAWRFELQASCAQGRRATRLRYAPTVIALLILRHFLTVLLIFTIVFTADCARMGYCTVRGSAAAWRGSNFPQACRERVQDIPQVLKRISFVWAMRSGGILREH